MENLNKDQVYIYQIEVAKVVELYPEVIRGEEQQRTLSLRARGIHGDKYDYSGVEYLKNNIHVKIKCIEHGEFLQRPYLHLSGRGCFQCGIKSKKTLEEFLQSSKEIHGEKYDYSKVKFVNNQTKICYPL